MKLLKKELKKIISVILIVSICLSLTVPHLKVYASQALPESSVSYKTENASIDFEITSHWDNGYNANVTITNTGSSKIDNWKLKLITTSEITNVWNANIEKLSDNTYLCSNAGWNQDIYKDQSVSFRYTSNSPIDSLPTLELVSSQITKLDEEKVNIIYKTTSEWNGGFTGEVTIINNSPETIEDWKLSLDFDGEFTSLWNATIISQNGKNIELDNNVYNGNIKPNESVSIGFTGKKNAGCIPGNLELSAYEEVSETGFNAATEMTELSDGQIEKAYLENAIYPGLILNGLSTEDVRLSDDYDNDGLTLIEEYEYNTDPFNEDTDRDGLTDYEEVNKYGTNPLKYDTDCDEMSDGTEVDCGLNPLIKDTDGNGVTDNEEIITQRVRLNGALKYSKETEGTIPSITITGKGEYSNKLTLTAEKNNKAITQISSLVGTAYDFTHEEFEFEKSTLTFTISDEILKEHEIENLAIAYYDEENGELTILDTTAQNNTVSAEVSHYSKYLVIDTKIYLEDNYSMYKEYAIKRGIADVVIVMDTTGSMGGAISNVKKNITEFTEELEKENVDIRLGLVEYRDIYEDGADSTINYGWFRSPEAFKKTISSFTATGGGDFPESAVDALCSAMDMQFRTGVQKYIILVTDAGYKEGTAEDVYVTMDDVIKKASENGISVSAVNYDYNDDYKDLSEQTDGILTNVYEDFAEALKPLISKMKDNAENGCWVRLSNGSVVFLKKDPKECDYSVDTDEDGIPDIFELSEMKNVQNFDISNKKYVTMEEWTFSSNPADPDTDGDGLLDGEDYRPVEFDTVLLQKEPDFLLFNTGHMWKMVDCTAEEYLGKKGMYAHANCMDKYGKDISFDRDVDYNMEELTYITLFNVYGIQIYMSGSKYVDEYLDSEVLFERLTGRESKYFRHTGILWWESWKEVDKGTAGMEAGWWNPQVLREADFNVNTLYLTKSFDILSLINTFAEIGCIVIAAILAVEATPYIAANLEALTYCVKQFGVKDGLDFYLSFGTNAPSCADGIIGAVRFDTTEIRINVTSLAKAVKETKSSEFLALSEKYGTSLTVAIQNSNKMEDAVAFVTQYSTEGVELYLKYNDGAVQIAQKYKEPGLLALRDGYTPEEISKLGFDFGKYQTSYGKSIEISDEKMYQVGDHFNKHGREMGYLSKKEYEQAARDFFEANKDTCEIYEGIFNTSRGVQSGKIQYILRQNGKQLIISKETGQIIDFYEGTSLDAFINVERLQ